MEDDGLEYSVCRRYSGRSVPSLAYSPHNDRALRPSGEPPECSQWIPNGSRRNGTPSLSALRKVLAALMQFQQVQASLGILDMLLMFRIQSCCSNQQEKGRAMVNEMVGKLTSICWDKCITGTPGSKFSSSEVSCVTNCAQRRPPGSAIDGASRGKLILTGKNFSSDQKERAAHLSSHQTFRAEQPKCGPYLFCKEHGPHIRSALHWGKGEKLSMVHSERLHEDLTEIRYTLQLEYRDSTFYGLG
ncbi:Mitochondrial import inner membrane translocase subunit [Nymphaea thermarum]|nr:Mitochondrial import inner membrane translocase subunit [Nymphaea thermarum]